LYGALTHPDLGTLASVAGLFVSLYVLRTVHEIRKRVLLKLRAGDTIEGLEGHAGKINDFMNDFVGSVSSIENEMALAGEILKNLRKKVDGDPKKTIATAIKEIHTFRNAAPERKTREVARRIYTDILVCANAVRLLVADYREEP
jgi:N-methylhydantoinase A/oxoprolinase/acetone carboxylase beta subunit